jgi:hypothetical protein
MNLRIHRISAGKLLTELFIIAGWVPALVFVIHVIVSRVFNMYEAFPALDIPMHFTGGVAIAFFFARNVSIVFIPHLTQKSRILGHIVMVFALTATATVFWEFAEFIYDRVLGTHVQVSIADTMLDMFLGILGGCCYLLVSGYLRQIGHELKLKSIG